MDCEGPCRLELRGGWKLAMGQGLCPLPPPAKGGPFQQTVLWEAPRGPGHSGPGPLGGWPGQGDSGQESSQLAASWHQPPPLPNANAAGFWPGCFSLRGQWGFPSRPPPALRFLTLVFLEIFASVCLCPCRVWSGAAPVPTGSCFSDWAGGRGVLHPASTGRAVRVLVRPQGVCLHSGQQVEPRPGLCLWWGGPRGQGARPGCGPGPCHPKPSRSTVSLG